MTWYNDCIVNSERQVFIIMTQETLNHEELIALLAVYESEFEHRDKALYSHAYRLFYVSMIIMLCPFISIGEVSIKLVNVPSLLFIIAGMGCAVFAYIIAIIHADRLSKISKTYRKVNNMLPSQYRRISTIDPDKRCPLNIREQFMNI